MPPATSSDFARRARAIENAILRLAEDSTRAITPEIARETVAKLDEAPRLDARLDENEARCVEHAWHRAAVALVREAQTRGVGVMRYGGGKEVVEATDRDGTSGRAAVARLFEHALTLVEASESAVSGGMIFTTIEIVLEACTIAEAEDVLLWCDENKTRLRETTIWKKGKLPTLRMLIALAKRCVGRSSDEARVKGRALVLISWFMGLSDRSGMNKNGDSNPETTAIFEQEEWLREELEDGVGVDADVNIKMEVDSGEGDVAEDDDNEFGVDDAFHRTFWSLQQYFQDPSTTMSKNGAWNSFHAILCVVLDKFEAFPLGETAGTIDEEPESEKRKMIGHRFLTARRLLPLQMKDFVFRRQILIQAVFFLQYMDNEKFKEHVVDDEVAELSERVMKILKRTGPNAVADAGIIENALEDELSWSKWKDQGCPNFEKQPIDFATEPMPDNWDKKYSNWPPDQYPPDDPNLKYDFDHPELNRLWNLGEDDPNGTSVDALKDVSVEEFFKPCLEEMDPSQQVEAEYRRVNDPTFRWKAMRMLSKNHLHLFPKIAAEGLESVVPDILGVPDPRPPKEKSVEEQAKESTPAEEGNTGTGGKQNLLGSHDEVLDGALEPIEGDVDMEEEEKQPPVVEKATGRSES